MHIELENPTAVHDAFATQYGYQETISDGEEFIANPESKESFFLRKVKEYISEIYCAQKHAEELAKIPVIEPPVMELTGEKSGDK